MRTVQIYQAQLPLRNHRIVTPLPMPPKRPRPPETPRISDALAHNLKRSVEYALMFGFWECRACGCKCERVEASKASRPRPTVAIVRAWCGTRRCHSV